MKAFRSLLVVLLVAALGILGAQWLGHASARGIGEVIVRAGGNDYIATLPQAALALLIAGLLLWLLWALVSAPFRSWARYRRKQGRARLIDGLQALDGGQWQRAEKLLQSAATEAEARPIALVAAMRSAEARGDAASANQYLQQLASTDATLHALHSAERWLQQQRPHEAISALDLPAIQPLPPRALYLRTEALAAAGRAEEAYGQLGALRQQHALPADALAALETRLALQMLDEATDINVLAARWEVLPKPLRATPEATAHYASRAVALNWNDAALHGIEQALDSHWDENLIALYGTLPTEKLDSRRASAQRWLQTHPVQPRTAADSGTAGARSGPMAAGRGNSCTVPSPRAQAHRHGKHSAKASPPLVKTHSPATACSTPCTIIAGRNRTHCNAATCANKYKTRP